MCKVSSFVDEDFQQTDILVLGNNYHYCLNMFLYFLLTAPPQNILLYPVISDRDEKILNVTCRVEDIYPVPDIALSWTVK